MKIHWFVESFPNDSSYRELEDEIKAQGHLLTSLKNYNNQIFTPLSGECYLFNGSVKMCQTMKERLPYSCNTLWFTEYNYKCSKYYTYFGDLLFNREYTIMSLKEVIRNKFFIYGLFGRQAKIFLRPDSGAKPFVAELVDLQDIDKFANNYKSIQNELVLVSNPKNIRGEYRFIVSANKDIIAHSTYLYQGLVTRIPFVPRKAKEKCEDILRANYHPDVVYCIDIVEDTEGIFWLMELNAYSSCCLYSCDKKAIVEKVSKIAMDIYRG
jgi:hypothetical protein